MDYENLPDDWPDMYGRQGVSECPHQMHWVDDAEHYECLHGCGYTEETPPDSKLT